MSCVTVTLAEWSALLDIWMAMAACQSAGLLVSRLQSLAASLPISQSMGRQRAKERAKGNQRRVVGQETLRGR